MPVNQRQRIKPIQITERTTVRGYTNKNNNLLSPIEENLLILLYW